MGVKMIVKKAFRPAGSGSPMLEPGSPFVADSESQAKLCRAMGWCEYAPAEEVKIVPFEPPKRTYTRKVVEPVVEPTAEPEKVEPTSENPPRRRYQRRDLTAKTDD
jgi:hypothetical protein